MKRRKATIQDIEKYFQSNTKSEFYCGGEKLEIESITINKDNDWFVMTEDAIKIYLYSIYIKI